MCRRCYGTFLATDNLALAPFGAYHKALALAYVGDFEGADRLFSGEGGASFGMTRRGVTAHVEVLTQLGFVPRVPVAAMDLASADHRRAWIADRHMVAFSFFRPGRPLDEVDVLIDPPLTFAELVAGADLVEAEGLRLPIVGVRDLIRMKEHAGRAQDVADADALRRLLEGAGA